MALFIALYAVCLLFSIFEVNNFKFTIGKYEVNYKKYFFLFFWTFILMLGLLRNERYGYDWYGYKYDYFLVYRNMTILQVLKRGIDVGYGLLNLLIGKFTSSFVVFRNIIYSITHVLLGIWIYKKSPIKSISCMVYLSFGFLPFDFFIMRQALAVSILVWGYDFIEKKQFIRYLLVVIIAALFHSTALVAIIFYPLANSKIKMMSFWKHSFIVVFLAICSPILIQYAVNIYTKGRYSTEIIRGEGINRLLFLIVFILVIAFYNRNEKFINKDNNGMFEIVISMLYLQTIAVSFSLFSRVSMYSVVYMIVFLPMCIYKCTNKSNKRSFFAVIIVLLTILYVFELRNGINNMYIPYIPFWKSILTK